MNLWSVNAKPTAVNIESAIDMEEAKRIENAIRENAVGPKSAEVDGQKVEQHSLRDQMAADAYLASKRAMKSRNSGLKIMKLTHSGA